MYKPNTFCYYRCFKLINCISDVSFCVPQSWLVSSLPLFTLSQSFGLDCEAIAIHLTFFDEIIFTALRQTNVYAVLTLATRLSLAKVLVFSATSLLPKALLISTSSPKISKNADVFEILTRYILWLLRRSASWDYNTSISNICVVNLLMNLFI